MHRKQHGRKYAEMHTSITIRQFWFFFLITFIFFLTNMNAFDMSENVQFNFLTIQLKKKGFFFHFHMCLTSCRKGGAYICFLVYRLIFIINSYGFQFLQKDVRDILTPIQIEATYHLGHHVVSKRSIEEFPPLQPILQQKKEKDIIEKTVGIFFFI